MISAHGNKMPALFAGISGLFLTVVVLLAGGLLCDRSLRIRLYEKKNTAALASLEAANQQVKNEIH